MAFPTPSGQRPQYITVPQATTYARNAGFSGQSLDTIIAIALAESGQLIDGQWMLQTNAINTQYGAGGVLQILPLHGYGASVYDPARAFSIAYSDPSLSNQGTRFTAWETFTNSRYKEFLGMTGAAPQAPSTGGAPSPGVFGLVGSMVRGVVDAATSTTMRGLDTQETGAFGGATTHEWDYLLPSGATQGISLPSGASYQVVHNSGGGLSANNGVGGILTVRITSGPQAGGILSFLHLSNQISAPAGSMLNGGTQIGTTGGPTNPAYGIGGATFPSNAFGAVAVDQKGQAFLDTASGGSGGGNPVGGFFGGVGGDIGGAASGLGSTVSSLNPYTGLSDSLTGAASSIGRNLLPYLILGAGFVIVLYLLLKQIGVAPPPGELAKTAGAVAA